MTSGVRKFLSIGECMMEFAKGSERDWKLGFAGDTFNTAWYFNKLIDPKKWQVEFFTRLGRDSYSYEMLNFMREQSIGTYWIARDENRQPGLYLIETENGERSFTYWRERSAARLLADDEYLLKEALSNASIVYFSGITLAILEPERREFLLQLMNSTKADGKMVVFDPNIRPRLWESEDAMRDWLTKAVGVCDLALPSFDDEKTWFGDVMLEACADRFLHSGAEQVIVKNAGGRICIADENTLQSIDDLSRVDTIVDSTGAGDAFNGALLAALESEGDRENAVRKAHDVAAKVIQSSGALVSL